MEIMMHLAAQYLAAAAIGFLPEKKDDSHTNLGFDVLTGSLRTHPLSEDGDQLALNYHSFALEWISPTGTSVLSLDGTNHAKVLDWLNEISNEALGKPYHYYFHYELPYTLDNAYIFSLKDPAELQELLRLRTLAQTVLTATLKKHQLTSAIRIWPHHFDTGAYAQINQGSKTALGLGLAIPDTLCTAHYFYISGYNEQGAINTTDFPKPSIGTWKNEGFKGGMLATTNLKEEQALSFFDETIAQYKSQ